MKSKQVGLRKEEDESGKIPKSERRRKERKRIQSRKIRLRREEDEFGKISLS